LGVTRHRAVLPFDPDPRLLGAFLALAMTAAAVVMGLALRRLIGRFLPEDGRPAPSAHRASDALRRDVHRHRGVGVAATPLKVKPMRDAVLLAAWFGLRASS